MDEYETTLARQELALDESLASTDSGAEAGAEAEAEAAAAGENDREQARLTESGDERRRHPPQQERPAGEAASAAAELQQEAAGGGRIESLKAQLEALRSEILSLQQLGDLARLPSDVQATLSPV